MPSSIVALVLGSLAAYGLRRGSFAGRDWAEGNFMAPLIVPTIIVAIALYLGLAKIGLLGSLVGLVVAHTILSVPLVMMVMGVAIREFDPRIEQVAWSLGASWRYTVWKVMLPNLAPSVFAAWIFAFIGSFDEVIVTSFIAGKYETVPKKIRAAQLMKVPYTLVVGDREIEAGTAAVRAREGAEVRGVAFDAFAEAAASEAASRALTGIDLASLARAAP